MMAPNSPATARDKVRAIARRQRRWLMWPGAALTLVGVVLFLVSVWGITWISEPRFPNDPPTASFPKDYPMRMGGRLARGRLFFTNRWGTMSSALIIHRESLPTSDVQWWRSRNGFLGYRAMREGSSAFHIWFDVPVWPPIVVGCGLLITYRILSMRRAKPGQCTACRYDRAGMDGNAACPECGLAP